MGQCGQSAIIGFSTPREKHWIQCITKFTVSTRISRNGMAWLVYSALSAPPFISHPQSANVHHHQHLRVMGHLCVFGITEPRWQTAELKRFASGWGLIINSKCIQIRIKIIDSNIVCITNFNLKNEIALYHRMPEMCMVYSKCVRKNGKQTAQLCGVYILKK